MEQRCMRKNTTKSHSRLDRRFRPQQRQKKSQNSKRYPTTPMHRPPSMELHPARRFQRQESQQDGPKNNGSTTDSNTLMAPCEKPKSWPPIPLLGMRFGWLSQHAVLEHGTCDTFPLACKQLAPLPFSERRPCSRSSYGRGLNFEVVEWTG